MSVWSNAPLTLRAYVVLSVATSVVSTAITGNPIGLLGVTVTVVIAYFLLTGVRWLWFLSIAFSIIGLITPFTLDWSTLHRAAYIAQEIIGLALLLVPETRRHFEGHDATPANADA
jgi:hypothetical protein